MAANRTAAERAAETVAQIRSDLAVLERMRRREDEMRARIAAWERHCGVPSDDVHRAIDDGRLVESSDVADWIMTYALVSGTASIPRHPKANSIGQD